MANKVQYELVCMDPDCTGRHNVLSEELGIRCPSCGEYMCSYPVVDCDCGDKVFCYSSWSNECDHCGREYSGSGKELSDRRIWGEETGESFSNYQEEE